MPGRCGKTMQNSTKTCHCIPALQRGLVEHWWLNMDLSLTSNHFWGIQRWQIWSDCFCLSCLCYMLWGANFPVRTDCRRRERMSIKKQAPIRYVHCSKNAQLTIVEWFVSLLILLYQVDNVTECRTSMSFRSIDRGVIEIQHPRQYRAMHQMKPERRYTTLKPPGAFGTLFQWQFDEEWYMSFKDVYECYWGPGNWQFTDYLLHRSIWWEGGLAHFNCLGHGSSALKLDRQLWSCRTINCALMNSCQLEHIES